MERSKAKCCKQRFPPATKPNYTILIIVHRKSILCRSSFSSYINMFIPNTVSMKLSSIHPSIFSKKISESPSHLPRCSGCPFWDPPRWLAAQIVRSDRRSALLRDRPPPPCHHVPLARHGRCAWPP